MKKIALIAFLGILSNYAFCQELAGKRIISGSASITISTQSYTQTGTPPSYNDTDSKNVNVSLLYGKIKNNNTYIAYGGTISITSGTSNTGTSSSSNSSYSIGPNVQFGKFSKIFESFYFAPTLDSYVSYRWVTQNPNDSNNSQTGFNIGASAQIIRFMYQIQNNFYLSAGFGSAGISYTSISNSNDKSSSSIKYFNLSGGISNTTNFGVFYAF